MSLTDWLNGFRGTNSQRRTSRHGFKSRSRRRQTALLSFEQLESRTLLAAGGLDLSFGGDGTVTTDIGTPGSTDRGQDVVAYQSDGKSIVVGYSANDMVVVRYNADGILDTTFANNGPFWNSKVRRPWGVSMIT